MSTEHHVTREDLLAAVWERPLTKVAADYGNSDVARGARLTMVRKFLTLGWSQTTSAEVSGC